MEVINVNSRYVILKVQCSSWNIFFWKHPSGNLFDKELYFKYHESVQDADLVIVTNGKMSRITKNRTSRLGFIPWAII
jgi:hypothetical protein